MCVSLGAARAKAFARTNDWLSSAARRPLAQGVRIALATIPDDAEAADILATVPVAIAALIRAQAGKPPIAPDPSLATGIADGLFPPEEVPLIADLIARDAPFYDASISVKAVEGLNKFAMALGVIAEPVPYDRLVASQFSRLWNE